jgi:gamma-glutamylcyclotransferase
MLGKNNMKYFAYGSNMLSERLKARVSSANNPKHYALQKHHLRFHKKSIDCSGKCSIVATESDKDVVHGVLFDVADDQIDALDRAEGVGYGYQRNELILMLDGTWTKMFVYVAEEKYIDESLVPYRWYYDLVLAGAEQHALPSDYVAGLQAIPFTQDPKSDRKSRLEALEVLKKYTDSKKNA